MPKRTKPKTAAALPRTGRKLNSGTQTALWILLLFTITMFAMSFTRPRDSDSDVAEQAIPSVVLIEAEVEEEVSPFMFFFGMKIELVDTFGIKAATPPPPKTVIRHYGGTGFFVNGRLLTANHVVDPGENGKLLKITLTTERGEKAPAVLVRGDKESDIAELATPLNAPTLRLAAVSPKRGDSITQIGNPASIRFVISKGTIVGFDREQGYNIAALDTFGGNSGGPDLNARGEVVGMCHTLIRGSRFTGIGTLQAITNFLYPDTIR